MAARRIAAKTTKKSTKITPATRTPIRRNRNVGVVSSTGSVQAGSFSPQLPDPLESPTQADPPSDLSLPTSLRLNMKSSMKTDGNITMYRVRFSLECLLHSSRVALSRNKGDVRSGYKSAIKDYYSNMGANISIGGLMYDHVSRIKDSRIIVFPAH
jgi:hypothetical protein